MNIAPQKYGFINLKDLQNLSKVVLNQNTSKVATKQFKELYETNKIDTIYLTENDIKEYNKSLAMSKVKEILKDYSQNIISNNKIFNQELSYNNHFNKDAYFKSRRATDEKSMLDTLKSGYLENTKFKNLNDYAFSNTLKTNYGEVAVFLDLYGDNDELGIGKLENNSALFSFDSNSDGILDSSDKLFDKLKVRGYDKDGNEKIANLSDVMPRVDLRQFISTNIINYNQIAREELNNKAIITNNPDLYVDTKEIDHRHS